MGRRADLVEYGSGGGGGRQWTTVRKMHCSALACEGLTLSQRCSSDSSPPHTILSYHPCTLTRSPPPPCVLARLY